MKYKVYYVLALLIPLSIACTKKTPVNIPDGTFTGQFLSIHVPASSSGDTLKANVVVSLNNTAKTYTVGGDTSTVHAGSHGTYILYTNSKQLSFFDSTFPSSGGPAKIHLSGVYSYTYDGMYFDLIGTNGVSQIYQYKLIKN